MKRIIPSQHQSVVIMDRAELRTVIYALVAYLKDKDDLSINQANRHPYYAARLLEQLNKQKDICQPIS